jgi:hypothetical protein
MAAMTGGGLRARPGEVSMAHMGVLFLDELPEFQRAVLDSLRQPLETGEVSVARANAHVTYPARVQLIAAMNPCRCGYLSDPGLGCSRAPRCGSDYQGRVSGPLLDRIDLHVDVDPVSALDLALPPPKRAAPMSPPAWPGPARASDRLAGSAMRTNADLTGDVLELHAKPDAQGQALLMQAAAAMKLSARGYTASCAWAHHRRSGGGRNRHPHAYRRSALLPPTGCAELSATCANHQPACHRPPLSQNRTERDRATFQGATLGFWGFIRCLAFPHAINRRRCAPKVTYSGYCNCCAPLRRIKRDQWAGTGARIRMSPPRDRRNPRPKTTAALLLTARQAPGRPRPNPAAHREILTGTASICPFIAPSPFSGSSAPS